MNLYLSTEEFKETFVGFDKEIRQRLKVNNCGYKLSKTSRKYWADMLEEDPDFAEEFKMVFNNADIPEADFFYTRGA